MWVVTLTLTQANNVRGKIADGEALDPLQLADGTWFLPARCLIPLAQRRPALAAIIFNRARRNCTAADFVGDVDPADLAVTEAIEAARFRNLDTGAPTEVAT